MARPIKDSIQTVRLPFIGNPTNRDTVTSTDQRFVNVYFDVIESAEGAKTFYLVKRPGYSTHNNPPGTTAVGRGVYSWNGNVYSVMADKIYKGTTDLGVTLTTTTGLVGFAEVHPIASTQRLCINDGVKLYVINTADAVTTVTANFPANTTDLVFMDRYLFVLKSSNSAVHQCDLDDPTTWDATKTITAQMYHGTSKGLARQGPYLYVLTDNSMQAFYDAGNASGSVLTNIPEAALQVGCASQNSIAYDEDSIFWVTNSRIGGSFVAEMKGGRINQVSTPGIERLLRAEVTSISTANGKLIRLAGHRFYILKLTSANRTLVYDTETQLWCEWEAAATGAFPIISYTQHGNVLVGQHATEGKNYSIRETHYQDNAVNFTVLGRFKPVDIDDTKRKFVRSAELIGDRNTSTTNVSLQYSDDDFTTLSTARTLDMSQPSPMATRLGNFERRAWQFSYAGANFLRLQALQLKLRLGSN